MEKDTSIDIKALSVDVARIRGSLEAEKLILSQMAYLIIKDLIRNLKLSPGQMILERTLVEILNMSRTPVREALVRLEMEGWGEIVPRHGFVVVDIKAEDVQQVFEMVETLDELAIRLAVEQITEEDLMELERIISRQREAINERNALAWNNLDHLFHEKIIEMANHTRLSKVRAIEYDHLYRVNLYTMNMREISEESLIEHEAILGVMKAREAEAARIMLKSHRARAFGEIVGTLQAMEDEKE